MHTHKDFPDQKWKPKSFKPKANPSSKKTGFKDDESGVAAIEFAMIGVPFFMIIFGVMEIAFLFFGNTNIEYATREAARLIRTGQAQTGDFTGSTAAAPAITREQFTTLVCQNMFLAQNCETKLKVQVRTFPTWGDIDDAALSLPVDGNGDFTDLGLGFETPQSCQVTIVRAFYETDLLAQLPWLGSTNHKGVSNLNNGNYLHVGSAIFQTEPFQNACP